MFNKNFEKEITIEGMHCMHCAKKVEDTLSKIKGVKKVSVELSSGKVKILSKDEINNELLKAAVETLGYSIKS